MNSSTWQLWSKLNHNNVTFLGISQKTVSSLDQDSMGKFLRRDFISRDRTGGTQALHGGSNIDSLSLISEAYTEIWAGISPKNSCFFKFLNTLGKILYRYKTT